LPQLLQAGMLTPGQTSPFCSLLRFSPLHLHHIDSKRKKPLDRSSKGFIVLVIPARIEVAAYVLGICLNL